MKFPICLFMLYFPTVWTVHVQAEEENLYSSRLWLPIAYEKHYTRLLDAAKKLDGYDQCHQLIDGKLSESRSSKNKPVFVFRCRNEQRKMYLYYIDAKQLHITSQQDKWKKSDEEREQQQLRQLLADRDKYWKICEVELDKIWKNFNQPEAVGRIPPRPDITSEKQLLYEVEFTTLSPRNTRLSYLATAIVGESKVCNVDIKPI